MAKRLADLIARGRSIVPIAIRGRPIGFGTLLWVAGDGRLYIAPVGTPWPLPGETTPYATSPAWIEVEI